MTGSYAYVSGLESYEVHVDFKHHTVDTSVIGTFARVVSVDFFCLHTISHFTRHQCLGNHVQDWVLSLSSQPTYRGDEC